MKKLFTLLFASLVVSAVSAQSGRNDSYGKSRQQPPVVSNSHGSYSNSRDSYDRIRDRDAQVLDIRREYDRRIMDVKYRRSLNNRQKNKMIASLEKERAERIEQVYRRFQERNYGYADRNYRNDRAH